VVKIFDATVIINYFFTIGATYSRAVFTFTAAILHSSERQMHSVVPSAMSAGSCKCHARRSAVCCAILNVCQRCCSVTVYKNDKCRNGKVTIFALTMKILLFLTRFIIVS